MTPNRQAHLYETSSPLQHAGEPGPGYRQHLPRELLVRRLNLLIEAQRAAAYLARHVARRAVRQDVQAWARALQREKVGWCNTLSADVRALGESPSKAVGGLYDQAVAIGDLDARLAFLNRHEAWVIRRLKALLPRIPADALHAHLLSMLAAQHYSLSETERVLKNLRRSRSPGRETPSGAEGASTFGSP